MPVIQERERPVRPPSFIRNEHRDSVNLLAAESLVRQGLPVQIVDDAVDMFGKSEPAYRAIYSEDLKAKSLYSRITRTPEVTALREVVGLIVLKREEPDVDSCAWDDSTKVKVRARYHAVSARYYRDLTFERKRRDKTFSDADDEQTAHKHEETIKNLLPEGMSHLTSKEINILVDQVVERELSKDSEQATS